MQSVLEVLDLDDLEVSHIGTVLRFQFSLSNQTPTLQYVASIERRQHISQQCLQGLTGPPPPPAPCSTMCSVCSVDFEL